MKITYSALIELVKQIPNGRTFGLETVTAPKMRKTGNPFLGAVKSARWSGQTGVSYEDVINARIEKCAPVTGIEFKAAPIWGGKGEYVVPKKVVRHIETGALYLAVQGSDKQIEAFPPSVKYLDGDKEIPVEEIKPFLVESAPSAKQQEHGLQANLQNIRMVSLSSIRVIHYGGETYNLVPDEAAA